MENTNAKLRQQFSDRLKKEFVRLGLPVASPTQIANEFNSRYPASKVAAQTVRKWLLADAIPTQAKLVSLADWLSVSPQWLRFGTGARKATSVKAGAHENAGMHTGVFVVGQHQAGLVPVVELLTRLSASNVRLVVGLIRCVLAEQEKTKTDERR